MRMWRPSRPITDGAGIVTITGSAIGTTTGFAAVTTVGFATVTTAGEAIAMIMTAAAGSSKAIAVSF